MTCRLVLELPFKMLLIQRRIFHDAMRALRFKKRRYPSIPFEVWDQSQVSRWSGRTFVIPITKRHGGRKHGTVAKSE